MSLTTIDGCFSRPPEVRITCAICDKPVDQMRMDYDVANGRHIVTVWCHGDTDTCEIPEVELARGQIDVTSGRAFTTKRIQAGESK